MHTLKVKHESAKVFSGLRTVALFVSLVTFLFASAAHELHLEQTSAVDCDVCLVFGSVAPGTVSSSQIPLVIAGFEPAARLEHRWSAIAVLVPSSRGPPAIS